MVENWRKMLFEAYESRNLDTLRVIIENSPLEWSHCVYPVSGRKDWHWSVAEMFWRRAFPGHWREKIVELHGDVYAHPRTQPIPVLPC